MLFIPSVLLSLLELHQASEVALDVVKASSFPGHVLYKLNDVRSFSLRAALGICAHLCRRATTYRLPLTVLDRERSSYPHLLALLITRDCSALYQKNATEGVLTALNNGWRHIDNARIYGNEVSVGAALKAASIPRNQLFITSKYDAIDGEDVHTEFNKSLADLGVDYLDLYLIHFPRFAEQGGGIKKVWRQFEEIKRSGRARSIGVSNYYEGEMQELLNLAEIKP